MWRNIYIFNYNFAHYSLSFFITIFLHGEESLLRSESRNSPRFVETEGSVPHLQMPAACPYAEPDQHNLCPQPTY
jgi:hypothetical protein